MNINTIHFLFRPHNGGPPTLSSRNAVTAGTKRLPEDWHSSSTTTSWTEGNIWQTLKWKLCSHDQKPGDKTRVIIMFQVQDSSSPRCPTSISSPCRKPFLSNLLSGQASQYHHNHSSPDIPHHTDQLMARTSGKVKMQGRNGINSDHVQSMLLASWAEPPKLELCRQLLVL